MDEDLTVISINAFLLLLRWWRDTLLINDSLLKRSVILKGGLVLDEKPEKRYVAKILSYSDLQ